MLAVTPTSSAVPILDLFLVKTHVNMQNRSVPYQSQMHSPFLEVSQNNQQKTEFKGLFCFVRDMNKQPLKIVLFEGLQ